MRLLLFLYGCLHICNTITLFARTERGLSLIYLNITNRSVTSSLLMDGISEDVSLSLAVDSKESVGFYAMGKDIFSVNFPNASHSDVRGSRVHVRFEEQPTSLAFDWITNQIYLAFPGHGHESYGRIMLCSLGNFSPSECSILFHEKLEYISSIALDSVDGNMYWLNGIGRSLEKSFMNGKHHDMHPFDDSSYVSEDEPTLSSLVLHRPSKRLYFAKILEVASEIWSCQLYKRHSCTMVAVVDQIVHLTVSKSHIIWSSSRGRLSVCDLENCSATIRLFETSPNLETFVVVDPEMQPRREMQNPCSPTLNHCSHFCVLVHFEPWSTCSCPVGVRLLEDERTCDPRGIDKVLLVSAISGVYQILLENNDFSPQVIPFEGYNKSTHKLYDVDYDPFWKKVYWIDAEINFIRRSNLDGSETENVIPLQGSVKVFRIDYVNRNIYWIDNSRARIYVTSLRSNRTSVVVNGRLAKPQGLDLDLKNNHIYFSDGDKIRSRIERCGLDGSGRTTLLNLTSHSWPNGLVVDVDESRIYWTEGNYSVIKTAQLNGSHSAVIGPATAKLLQPYGITKLGNTIYCNSLAGRSFMKTVIDNTTDKITSSVLESSIYGPIGIKAVALHSESVIDAACRLQDVCHHICVAGVNGPSCLCANGYELQKDLRTCQKPSAFAIISSQDGNPDISRLSLSSVRNMLPLGLWNGTLPPQSMDFDQESKVVYLTSSNAQRGSIFRIGLDGSAPTIVLEGKSLAGIHSLAVDYVSKNIFWSNTISRKIEVCDSTGLFRRTVAWRDISPTKILVYPPRSILIYVDQSDNATIKSSSLSGSSEGGSDILGDLGIVSSITIDYKRELLYWSEYIGSISKVSVSKLDGTNRETLYVGQNLNPTHIFAFNFELYYVDNHRRTFGSYDAGRFQVIHESVPETAGLIIVHGNMPVVENECVYGSFVCPELCLSSISSVSDSCKCRDHFTYDPGSKSCLAPESLMLIGAEDSILALNIRKLPDRSLTWREDPLRVLPAEIKGRVTSMCIDLISRFVFWISDDDLSGYIHFVSETTLSRRGRIQERHDCEYFYSLAMDDIGRQLYASCKTRLGYGLVIVYHIEETGGPLRFVGEVVTGVRNSAATGHRAQPRHIAVFPFLNYLFYVDVSSNLLAPAIIQCQLDGRKCSLWFASDLWPITRLHADSYNLRLFYTSLSGVWSRDVGLASSNVQHHFHSINASDYALAPIDESSVIVAEISSGSTTVREVPSNTILSLPNTTTTLQRFGPISPLSKECRFSNCSHLCRVVRDSKQKYQCTCPLDYAIEANKPWLCLRNVRCKPWEFACDDGRTCIHAAKKCDRVPHCGDASDESPKICLNSGNKWPCDDGASSVERSLLCDGVTNCADGSDERHCRCPHPAADYDCAANPLYNSTECVSRKRLCDGFSDCENSMDEHPKTCDEFPHHLRPYTSSPEWVYIALLVLVFLVIAGFLIFCCFRHHPYCVPPPDVPASRYRLEHGAEASILLPNSTGITQFEVALRRYSLADSSSSYPVLPPPNSSQTYSSSERYSHKEDIPLSRFYAPPPSAASLSTYGVVKPADVRMLRRNQARSNTRTSPPPSYTMVDGQSGVGSLSGLSHRVPQMSSTPKSVRARRSQSRKLSGNRTASKTGSPLVSNSSRYMKAESSTAAPAPSPTPSSSSLSSHSSEEGFAGGRS